MFLLKLNLTLCPSVQIHLSAFVSDIFFMASHLKLSSSIDQLNKLIELRPRGILVFYDVMTR